MVASSSRPDLRRSCIISTLNARLSKFITSLNFKTCLDFSLAKTIGGVDPALGRPRTSRTTSLENLSSFPLPARRVIDSRSMWSSNQQSKLRPSTPSSCMDNIFLKPFFKTYCLWFFFSIWFVSSTSLGQQRTFAFCQIM